VPVTVINLDYSNSELFYESRYFAGILGCEVGVDTHQDILYRAEYHKDADIHAASGV
jgi:hypothetical protein